MSENGSRPEGEASLVSVAPGVARLAAAAAWRSAEWTVGAYVRVGGRVVQAAVSGDNPADFFRSSGADLRNYVRDALGFPEEGKEAPAEPTPSSTLRNQGEALLRRSADVTYPEGAHPAYARILTELAPDEGRILRLLAQRGDQPAVDVRGGLIPLESASHLVAPGLTMIGAEAGVRHGERLQAYLNNLSRLGLIWFSHEALEDPLAYQVLEAQPDVLDARKRAGRRGRTVRRSILLTPFGEDFCEVCLPLHTVELEAVDGEPGRE